VENMDRKTDEAIMVVRLSDAVQSIIDDREMLTTGDYQGCLEAVILKAIQYGRATA
jgi:hypothetical protein